jgi:deoxyribodipyrimidine photo-lyase
LPAVIWWIRRDLRLADNPALNAALETSQTVIPLFILDPALLKKPAPKRQAFLFDGLRALDADLRARGSRLILRQGRPREELSRLAAECEAKVIFAAEDYSPYARQRDGSIARLLSLHLTGGVTVHPPSAVHKADRSPYAMFTPFSKAWKALPLSTIVASPASPMLPPLPPLASLEIPASQPLPDFPAGEAEAQRRLRAFLEGRIITYAGDRNRLDLDGTSALSPYLRFGMLSPRQAVQAALISAQTAVSEDGRQGAEAWLNELIWREFYISILYYFPHVLRTAFNPALRRIPWRDDPAGLRAWQDGRTGYPVVDAAMRQLRHTGWMHNRGRMIVASFLAKNLLVDWRAGERWFMQHLVDGDPAANNGGWQWTAGVGTDAAPYFRIFNPVRQGMKFDPEGAYVRRWVPELARVPARFIHAPWQMPPEIQAASGCLIGADYPYPILDTTQTKGRTLVAYRLSKENPLT